MSEGTVEKPLPPIYFPDKKSVERPSTTYAQQLLLDALSNGITDPKKLQEIAGLKRVADVYLTLDKLSLRKEFHASLARAGIDLDLIAGKLKVVLENQDDEVKLKAISLLLKSIGLEKYDDTETRTQPWEDVIIAAAQDTEEVAPGKYEVVVPEMPEELRLRKELEKQEGQELHKNKQ